jgi:DNA topoisomerase IA
MPRTNAAGDLVIVESPAQATTIGRSLGPGYFATVSDVEG